LPPINPENGAFLSEEKLTAAIEEFQAFAGLNITGMLNFIYSYKFIIKYVYVIYLRMLQYIKVQYSTIYCTYNYGDVLKFLPIIISSF